MKKNNSQFGKRLLSIALIAAVLLSMLPVGVLAAPVTAAPAAMTPTETDKKSEGVFVTDDNGYIKYGVEMGSGGFYIQPSVDKFDDKKPLSRATFQIDGQAVDFGTLTDDDSTAVSPAFKNESGAVQMGWRYGDYTITQYLNIVRDDLNAASYAVSLGYNIVKDGKPAELPVRIALDTRYGANDDQPVMTEIGGVYVMRERCVEPAPANFRMDEYYSRGKAITYAILDNENFITPERVTFADFNHLADSAFDYEPDTEYCFTDPDGDSGAAIYYTVKADETEKDVGFVYGFMGLANTKVSASRIPAVQSPVVQTTSAQTPAFQTAVGQTTAVQPQGVEIMPLAWPAYDETLPRILVFIPKTGVTLTLSWTDGGSKSVTLPHDDYLGPDGYYMVNIPVGTMVNTTLSGSGLFRIVYDYGPHLDTPNGTFTVGRNLARLDVEPNNLRVDMPTSGYYVYLSWTDDNGSHNVTLPNPAYVGYNGWYYINIPVGAVVTATASGGINELQYDGSTFAGNQFTHTGHDNFLRLSAANRLTVRLPAGASVEINGTLFNTASGYIDIGKPSSIAPGYAFITNLVVPSGGDTYMWYFSDGTGADKIDGNDINNNFDDERDGYYELSPTYFLINHTATLELRKVVPGELIVKPGTGIAEMAVTVDGNVETFTQEDTYSAVIPNGKTVDIEIDYETITDISGPVYNDFTVTSADLSSGDITYADYQTASFVMPVVGGPMTITATAVDATANDHNYLDLTWPDGKIADASIKWEKTFDNVSSVTRTAASYTAHKSSHGNIAPTIPAGASVTVTLTYESGFTYDDFHCGGVSGLVGYSQSNNVYTFTMPDEPVSLTFSDMTQTLVTTDRTGGHNWNIALSSPSSGGTWDGFGNFYMPAGEVVTSVVSISTADSWSVSGRYTKWDDTEDDLVITDLTSTGFKFTVPTAKSLRLDFSATGENKKYTWVLDLDDPEDAYKGNITISAPTSDETRVSAQFSVGDGLAFKYIRTGMDYVLDYFDVYQRITVSEATSSSPAVYARGAKVASEIMQQAIQVGPTAMLPSGNPVYAFAPDNGKDYKSIEYTASGYAFNATLGRWGYAETGMLRTRNWPDGSAIFFGLPSVGDQNWTTQDLYFVPVFRKVTPTVIVELPSTGSTGIFESGVEFRRADGTIDTDWVNINNSWFNYNLKPGQSYETYIYPKSGLELPTLEYVWEEDTEYGNTGGPHSGSLPIPGWYSMTQGITSDGRVYAKLSFVVSRWMHLSGNLQIGVKAEKPNISGYVEAEIEDYWLDSNNIGELTALHMTGTGLRQMAEDDAYYYMLNTTEQKERTRKINYILWGADTAIIDLNSKVALKTGTISPTSISYVETVNGKDHVVIDFAGLIASWNLPATSLQDYTLELRGDGRMKWEWVTPSIRSGSLDTGGWVVSGQGFGEQQILFTLNSDFTKRENPASMLAVVQYRSAITAQVTGQPYRERRNNLYQTQIITGDTEAQIRAKAAAQLPVLAAQNTSSGFTNWTYEIPVILRGEVTVVGGGVREYDNPVGDNYMKYFPGEYYVGRGGGRVLVNNSLVYEIPAGGAGIHVYISDEREVLSETYNLTHYLAVGRGPNGEDVRMPDPDYDPGDVSYYASCVAMYPAIIEGEDGYLSAPGFNIGKHNITIKVTGIDYVTGEFDRDHNLIVQWPITSGDAFKIASSWGADIRINDIIMLDDAIVFGGYLNFELPIPDAKPIANIDVPRVQFGSDGGGDYTLQGIVADAMVNFTAEALGVPGFIGINDYGAKGRLYLDTFTHNYHVELALNFKVFEFEGELTLVPYKTGAFPVPDSMSIYIAADPGIDIIPMFPIATLKGGGGGFSGLGQTINGEYKIIPPVALSIRTNLEILKVFTIDSTVKIGVGTYEFSGKPEFDLGSFTIKPFSKFDFGFTTTDEFVRMYSDIEVTLIEGFEVFIGGGSLDVTGYFPTSSSGFRISFTGEINCKLQIPRVWIFGPLTLMNVIAGVSDKGVYAGISVLGIGYRIEYWWGSNSVGFSMLSAAGAGYASAEIRQPLYDEKGALKGEVSIGSNIRRLSNNSSRVGGIMPLALSPLDFTLTDNIIEIDGQNEFVLVRLPKSNMKIEHLVSGSYTDYPLVWAFPTGEGGEYTLEDVDPSVHSGLNAVDFSVGVDYNLMLTLAPGQYRITVLSGPAPIWNDVIEHYAASPLPELTTTILSGTTVSFTTANLKPATNYVVEAYLEEVSGVRRWLVSSTVAFTSASPVSSLTLSGLPNELPSGTYTVKAYLKEQDMNTANNINLGEGISVPTFFTVSSIEASANYTHANSLTPAAPTGLTVAPAGNGLFKVSFSTSGANTYYRIDALDKDGNPVLTSPAELQKLIAEQNQKTGGGQVSEILPAERLQYIVSPSDISGGTATVLIGDLLPGEDYKFSVTPFVYVDANGTVTQTNMIDQQTGEQRLLPTLEGNAVTTASAITLPVPSAPEVSFAAIGGKIEVNMETGAMTLYSPGAAQFSVQVSHSGCTVEVYVIDSDASGNVTMKPVSPTNGIYTVEPDANKPIQQIAAIATNTAGDIGEASIMYQVSNTAPMLYVETNGGNSIVTTSSTFTVRGFTSPGATVTVSDVLDSGGDLSSGQTRGTATAGADGSFTVTGLAISNFASGLLTVMTQLSGGIAASETVGIVHSDALPALTSGSISRAGNTATIGFTANKAGTVYYFVVDKVETSILQTAVQGQQIPVLDGNGNQLLDANGAPMFETLAAATLLALVDAAPDKVFIKDNGTQLSDLATGGAVSGVSIALTTGEKDVYIVLEDENGIISEPLKLTPPVKPSYPPATDPQTPPPPASTPPPPPGDDDGTTTELGGGITVTTPAGQDPVTNNDGSTTLPGGGIITTPRGSKIEAPPGANITGSGTVTFPQGSGGTITTPGAGTPPPSEEGGSQGGGITIAVPPGTVVGSDGKITFPQGSGGGTITDKYGNTFNVPEGATIILDGDTPLGYYISVSNPFTDVKSSDWFYNAVMFAYSHGLMNGITADSFSPNTPTTRGMIVTILWRMAGSPDMNSELGIRNSEFKDVYEDMWYTDAVKWAASVGIVNGYGNGRFGPNDPITRQDLAVILARYADLMGIVVGNAALGVPRAVEGDRPYIEFTDDADIANYAKEAVERLYKAKIISGYPDGSFKPQGEATRAEVAAMLMRFLETME